jgi:hypothetical protein
MNFVSSVSYSDGFHLSLHLSLVADFTRCTSILNSFTSPKSHARVPSTLHTASLSPSIQIVRILFTLFVSAIVAIYIVQNSQFLQQAQVRNGVEPLYHCSRDRVRWYIPVREFDSGVGRLRWFRHFFFRGFFEWCREWKNGRESRQVKSRPREQLIACSFSGASCYR